MSNTPPIRRLWRDMKVFDGLPTLPEPMANLTPAQWMEMGISQAEFAERWRIRLERNAAAPEIGSPAPDFNLEILSSSGEQTEEKFRLSSALGQPVGLIFGSYT